MLINFSRTILKTCFLALTALLLLFPAYGRAQEQSVYPVRLFMFHSETCPHCKEELKFLETLKSKYPNLEVREYEVTQDFKNQNLYKKAVEHYNLSGGVPTNIIGDKIIIGFDSADKIGKDIEKNIQDCSTQICSSWMDGLVGLAPITEKVQVLATQDQTVQTGGNSKDSISASFLGSQLTFDSRTSVRALGAFLGLIDGVNPCMFSVLLFMLSYLLAIGSRKKALKAGWVFILTTFVLCFIFMYGLIRVIFILEIVSVVRRIVTVIALVFGAIMIKDFFFYGKGISLEISDRFKPKIESLIKRGTMISAFLLALLAGLVVLPLYLGSAIGLYLRAL